MPTIYTLFLSDKQRARALEIADLVEGCDYIEIHQGTSTIDLQANDLVLMIAALRDAGDWRVPDPDRHRDVPEGATAASLPAPLADLRSDADKARDALLLAIGEGVRHLLGRRLDGSGKIMDQIDLAMAAVAQ